MVQLHVGVVGSGPLASLLVRRLVHVGHQVKVHVGESADRGNPAWRGAILVPVPADAAEDAELVLLALPDERAVEDGVFDCGGVSETLPDGHAVLNLSSVSAAYGIGAGERLATLGLRWLEGALVGSVSSASSWPLCFIGSDGSPVSASLLRIGHDLAPHVDVRSGVACVAQLRQAHESLTTLAAGGGSLLPVPA